MSDKKSKPTHIERTVYVSPNTRPGDSVAWDDWRDTDGEHTWYDGPESPGNPLGRYVARGIPMTIIEYASGSDYSGSLVERSNARCLKADFPWLITLHGGHGTFGVAYLGRREHQNDRLIEAIESLADYPLYSETDHSDLEWERASEAWDDYGRADFRRALTKYLDAVYEPDEHDLDLASDERIDDLWRAATERLQGGESFLNESGSAIHFPIDDVIEKLQRSWPGMSRPGYDGSPSLDEMLVRLAEDCTIATDTTEGA